jgi:hypothetical protein
MPQVLYSEQELSKLQELKTQKEALFKQYGELAKARIKFLEQNNKQLTEIHDKVFNIDNEIMKIQTTKEESF